MTNAANDFARKLTQYIMTHHGNIVVDVTTGTMHGIGWVTTDVARLVARRPDVIIINTYSYRQKHQDDVPQAVRTLVRNLMGENR